MNNIVYKDCYVNFNYSSHELIIGNDFVERKLVFLNGHPYCDYILNKESGKKWSNSKEIKMFNLNHLNECHYDIEVSYKIIDNKLRSGYLLVIVTLLKDEIKGYINFVIYPDAPFVTSRIFVKNRKITRVIKTKEDNDFNGIEMGYETKSDLVEDTIDSLGFDQPHTKITSYKLYDVTDANNTLVKVDKDIPYSKKKYISAHKYNGNIFLMDSYLEKEGLLIVKDAPTEFAAQNKTSEDMIVIPATRLMITECKWICIS